MPDVGVRELKARASEIIREVPEQRARYVITYRARPDLPRPARPDAPLGSRVLSARVAI